MEVYVIRHTPVAIDQDVCYGQSDVDVSDSFFKDVEAIRKQIPTDFDYIFSSPLKRCIELTKALGFNSFSTDKALMEMHFGDWENIRWNDINQQDLNKWMSNFVVEKTPNGENLLELFKRVEDLLDKLRTQPYKKILLVTHAGVIRCIWAYILEIPLQNIFKIPVSYGEVFKFNLGINSQTDSIKNK